MAAPVDAAAKIGRVGLTTKADVLCSPALCTGRSVPGRNGAPAPTKAPAASLPCNWWPPHLPGWMMRPPRFGAGHLLQREGPNPQTRARTSARDVVHHVPYMMH
eukprot:scaffold2544_cov401-Prasinococcus_capsulatus_cf.AAC.15